MKKQVLALSLLLALSSAGSAFAAVPKTLRIGTDPTYAPFESKNAQGQLVGFDIDLANEICKRMETKCTYVESDFDALIPSLKAKKLMPSSPRSQLPKSVSRKSPSRKNCTLQTPV